MGGHRTVLPGGVPDGARHRPAPDGSVRPWPPPSPPPSSRVPSTCSCSWSTATRSTSYDVPLAAVVDAFVAEVAGWETIDLQTLSEFLMVAVDPGRAQVPAPAARARRGRDRRGAGRAGRSATCCWPGSSSARPTRPPPTGSPSCSSRRPGPYPGQPGSTSTSWSTPPTSWRGSPPTGWPPPSCRATAERPVPVVDLYHVTVDTVTVADTVADPGPAPTPPGHGRPSGT